MSGWDRIVQALVQPYGISVAVETDIGAPFRKFRIDEGETVFEAVERACRFRAVLPLSDGAGNLILGSPYAHPVCRAPGAGRQHPRGRR